MTSAPAARETVEVVTVWIPAGFESWFENSGRGPATMARAASTWPTA